MTDKKQPEALRLANALDTAPYSSACTNDSSAELRRLHALCEEQKRLLEQAHSLCVAVNSAVYCYDKRPENFAVALRDASDESVALDTAITNHLRQQEGEKHD